jgi:hypothetical protein
VILKIYKSFNINKIFLVLYSPYSIILYLKNTTIRFNQIPSTCFEDMEFSSQTQNIEMLKWKWNLKIEKGCFYNIFQDPPPYLPLEEERKKERKNYRWILTRVFLNYSIINNNNWRCRIANGSRSHGNKYLGLVESMNTQRCKIWYCRRGMKVQPR